ncbi:hypothetical protein ABTX77_22035 [Streptomyces sp. NPDC097704]|uniref:hypothetical protein n=1 Tax=Streptomyces sp. NPDC097704 TaxID=3157101 RepID=UPI00333064BC
MAGDNHYGDVVNMNQTHNSVGIDKRTVVTGGSGAEVERAVRELLPLLQELRGGLGPFATQVVEAAEPEIEGSAGPEARRGALERVGGILESVGPAGAAALALVHQILGMLGG